MSNRGVEKLISAILSLIVIVGVFTYFFNFNIAWNLVSNFSPLIGFIITGVICAVLGLSERKFGSLIFGIVSLLLLINSFS